MAVYTSINKNDLKNLLKKYNIGTLKYFKGILEGVENSNYKISTTKNIYVLTIFEKRVREKDIPFFIKLQNYCSKKGFCCPNPIINKKGKYIGKIKNKNCVIMTFLPGKKLKTIHPVHCFKLGEQIATMHKKTKVFDLSRINSLGHKKWNKLFEKIKSKKNKFHYLFNFIEEELIFLKNYWPKNLPQGIIHADLFPDNVFFKKNSIIGIIDFYFSCKDLYAYDLAICINAWCFKKNYNLDINKLSAIIKGYEKKRKLSIKEKKEMPILLRGSAMRILLTRLYDKIYHAKGAFVEPKDPIEYKKILEFHQKNKLLYNFK